MEPHPLASSVALNEVVQLQPGAVVSRTLIKKPVGTVTLFAFDAGQGLSQHTAPYDAIVQAIEGHATITIGDQPHTLRQGQAILLPANIPHAVDAVSAFKMMLIMIRA
jgi:quercetin dioxygenase-like cupin family protein